MNLKRTAIFIAVVLIIGLSAYALSLRTISAIMKWFRLGMQ